MKFKWMLSTTLVGAMLAGCGTPLDEQLEMGFAASEQSFEADSKKPNTKQENIAFYLPEGFEVENSEIEHNYLLNHNGELYVLFVNALEDSSSKFAYEHLMTEQEDKIVEVKTYETEEAFGYSAVLEQKKDEYELVTALGGVKVSTLTKGKALDEKLAYMMEIAKSVQIEK